MSNLKFSLMDDPRHKEQVLTMMRGLYAEDQAASPVDESRFPRTIEVLLAEPNRGRIVLFSEDDALVGYALLIPYWSNEFGGALLIVDELFVIPEARNRGIGRSFLGFVEEQRPYDAVALALEVSPGNTRARWLYESIGFENRANLVMTRRLTSV
jgi:GNAT superfamily N-acetyltransferase